MVRRIGDDVRCLHVLPSIPKLFRTVLQETSHGTPQDRNLDEVVPVHPDPVRTDTNHIVVYAVPCGRDRCGLFGWVPPVPDVDGTDDDRIPWQPHEQGSGETAGSEVP